jgi:FtsP/CotA-like multicopper oxidase with cupredoxin domain
MGLETCSRLLETDDIQVDRRQFLKAALGTAMAMGLPALSARKVFSAAERRVKEFRLTASLAKVNLGTGPDFVAWTYNGQVPGPEIRVKEGETLRVILKNNLPEATTIHWHGLPVPYAMDGVPGVTQEAVKPGKSFVYEFEARPAGSYLYHSHVNYQLDQGLYGALIIEPSQSLKTCDREYTLVLEDWVKKDGGGVANTSRRPPMGMMHGRMHGMMRGRTGRSRRLRNEQDPLLEPVYDTYAVNGRVYPNAGPLMGERYDGEFEADNPGQWLLAAVDRGFGEGMLRIPLEYKGVKRAVPVPPLFHRGLRFHSYWDFQALHPIEDPVRQRANRFYPQELTGGMHSPFWTINGWVYPNAQRLGVQEGELVRIG